MSSVYERLSGILESTFGVEPELLRPDATMNDLDMDSLAVAEFVTVVHQEFGITRRGEDLRRSSTLTEVAALVEETLAGAGDSRP